MKHRMSWPFATSFLIRLVGTPFWVPAYRALIHPRSELSGGGIDPLVAKHLWRAIHFSGPCRGVTPHRLRNQMRWIAVHYRAGSNPGWSF